MVSRHNVYIAVHDQGRLRIARKAAPTATLETELATDAAAQTASNRTAPILVRAVVLT